MAPNNIGPQAEWLYQHGALIGWPALCYIAWRASKVVTTLTATLTKAVGQVDVMAENHFPHMQASLAKQDGHLESMDGSLKTLVISLPAQLTRLAAKRKR